MNDDDLTAQQSIRFNLLRIVGGDTAAAKAAIEFVKDDALRYRVFADQHGRVTTETESVAKTLKAIKESEVVLTLFNDD